MAYIQCVFLYNSELWTVTKSIEHKIDVFQRNILRKILGYNWIKRISNESLYEKTKLEAFSVIVKRRRLRWLGHLLRLNPETPARISLEECLRPDKLYKGRPKITWLHVIKEDFKNEYPSQNIRDIFEKISILCQDRDSLREKIEELIV